MKMHRVLVQEGSFRDYQNADKGWRRFLVGRLLVIERTCYNCQVGGYVLY